MEEDQIKLEQKDDQQYYKSNDENVTKNNHNLNASSQNLSDKSILILNNETV